MHVDPLQRLSEAAHRLPGDVHGVTLPVPMPLEDAGLPTPASVPLLRRELGELLLDLGELVEPALQHALTRASGIWDQVDAFTVLDSTVRMRIERHRLQWQAWLQEPGPAQAAATEALLTLDACVGLVALLERRLATMVRLRLRDPDPRLVVDGRPFLDVAAALQAAGRAWV